MKEKVGRKQERRKLGKQEKEASEKRQRHRNERQKESTWIKKKKKGRKEGREKERDCRKMKSEMRIFPPGVWFFKPPGGPWTLI